MLFNRRRGPEGPGVLFFDIMAKKKVFDEVPYLTDGRITVKRVMPEDAAGLAELTGNDNVYRYLPTFLYEKQSDDMDPLIRNMYEDTFRNKESLLMGIYLNDGMDFCGLAEFYGFRDPVHKISLGYRLIERYWGRGIASDVVALLVDYLYNETDTEIITASTLPGNQSSARVLEKNGFDLVVRNSDEDWGFGGMTPTDKWIR
ncbi:MAG: GNAT family N-acetyltransferase [Mogibacterium sp.]|nr:GNAT family N-acetyltransferase [Mogibacterium sp.]